MPFRVHTPTDATCFLCAPDGSVGQPVPGFVDPDDHRGRAVASPAEQSADPPVQNSQIFEPAFCATFAGVGEYPVRAVAVHAVIPADSGTYASSGRTDCTAIRIDRRVVPAVRM
jgi:hypothetical protein